MLDIQELKVQIRIDHNGIEFIRQIIVMTNAEKMTDAGNLRYRVNYCIHTILEKSLLLVVLLTFK
jgi:hypothetical protein